MAQMTRHSDSVLGTYDGTSEDDNTPPTALVPTVELPVYGVRPVDRKWWLDQFIGELDNGQFSNAGRLGDGIKRDARVLGAIEQRNAGLFGAPLELLPSTHGTEMDPKTKQRGEPSPQAMDICEEVKAGWDKMFPRCELEELNQYGIIQGIGIAEKLWDTSKKPWTFTIDVRHPQFYLWLWNTGNYHLITLNRSLVRVPRRSTQFINFAPYGYKRAFLNGRLRALVDPWMMRQWDKNDWAHWCEIHGHPIRKAITPQQANPNEERAFVRDIGNIGSNTVVHTRQDKDGNKYDIELVEAMSMGWKGFEAMLSWCDREISNVLLGQSQSTDGQGGLGATDKPGDSVRNDIKLSDSMKLCEALYTQGLREYCEYNYGNADLAPRPKYLVEPPEDESKTADKDQKVGATLVAFKNAGAPVNVRQFLEERGYPLLTEEEEAAQKEEQAAEAQTQRDHEMALAKPPGEEAPPEKDAKRLHVVSEAMKNFRMAGAPIDDGKILSQHNVPYVDSED